MAKIWFVVAMLVLGGCATGIDPAKYNDAPAAHDAFIQCHGYGCTSKTKTGFTAVEWKTLGLVFAKNPAKTPEAERSKIAKAIALMETMIGDKTGTFEDLGEAVTLKSSTYQMDCIDETINTTHYITFLQQAGWLKFYETAKPTHRGYFIDGRWPHNTAEIREIKTGDLYVVDAFYRDNGEEPYVLPRDAWLSGWRPSGVSQSFAKNGPNQELPKQ